MGLVKSNVFLKNTGTVDEYLRAKILIYMKTTKEILLEKFRQKEWTIR